MTEDDSETVEEPTSGISRGIPRSEQAVAGLTGDFYRGELERAATWRSRLDQTTNWAVVLVAAILTWAFTSTENPHYVILIGVFGVSTFLVMEAVRYQEYDIWRKRVRIMQQELFAEMYSPESAGDADWQTKLSSGLREPEFQISLRQAFTHRLRRSYLALLFLLLAAWIARITAFEPSESWHETASILTVSGEVVTAIVILFYAVLVGITAWSARGSRVREFQE
jgi:uncharacterized membrane protein